MGQDQRIRINLHDKIHRACGIQAATVLNRIGYPGFKRNKDIRGSICVQQKKGWNICEVMKQNPDITVLPTAHC